MSSRATRRHRWLVSCSVESVRLAPRLRTSSSSNCFAPEEEYEYLQKCARGPRGHTALLATVLLAVFAVSVTAQTYQGAVRGLVRDAQGVIPGVEVVLINEETNAARTVTTNEVGEYAFPSVLPGTYSVRATLAGFKTEERKGLKLATQQNIVQDFTLEIGTLSEQITVTAEVPIVERSTATVATVMTSEQISALPIFGRNTFYSSISTPGVIQSGDPQFVRYQDQSGASSISMGGGPRRGNAYLLEGVSITDFVNRPSWVPSTEAIEDMRVQVKTYDAEMGRAAGGVFNVTARSGSNQFHGSGLYVSKPGWSTGNLFFAERAGTPKPSQYYYGWAGSVGGPVVKDKTFFWFSTDDYKQRSTRNNVLTVPTALERTGDFSQSAQIIYDPLTTRSNGAGGFIRDPFPGNKIPLNRLNPIALQYLTGLPLPQTGRSFNASATLDDGPQDQETFKVDQRWSAKWTTTGMYGHQKTKEPSSAFFGPLGTIPVDPGGGTLFRNIDFISVNNIFIPNNTTTVAVRYGYNTFNDNGGNFASFDTSTLGYPAALNDLLSPNAFPAVTMSGYQGLGHGSASATRHTGSDGERHRVEVHGQATRSRWVPTIAAFRPRRRRRIPCRSASRRDIRRDRTRTRPAPPRVMRLPVSCSAIRRPVTSTPPRLVSTTWITTPGTSRTTGAPARS